VRFKFLIIILSALVLSLGAGAQNGQREPESSSANSATQSEGDRIAYREQLRRSAEATNDQGSGSATQVARDDCDPQRLAYRERLRRSAEGQDDGNSPSTHGQSVEQCEADQAKPKAEASAGTNGDSPKISPAETKVEGSQVPASHPAGATQVSIRRAPSADNTEQSSMPATAQGGPTGAVSKDAYEKNLRRISEGKAPPPMGTSNLLAPREITTERNFIKNLAFDQLHIWESPFKLRDTDATWAVPFGIATGALIATDRDTSEQLAKPSRIDISKKISDAGLFAAIGAGAGFYGLGLITHDDHKRETGLLTGEAIINATLVAEALKYTVGRQRPFEADHFGHIGKGGSSFPSGHAIDTWAAAAVIAHEYPTPLVQIGAYGLATAVAATRVTAGQHFPSDVLVGSTFGYLIGRKMYNDHHNPELGGSEYGTFVTSERGPTRSIGSAYVPLDSWAYPVIEKLAGLGYVRSAFLDMRPWSRTECARIVQEADESGANDDPVAGPLLDSLKLEFEFELGSDLEGSHNRSARLESAYGRVTGIAGRPLNDSFHFGQTVINDYGRPYQRGISTETGFSGFAQSGPLAVYFRGEYQTAPSAPGYPLNVRQAIATIDAFPGNAPLPVLPNEPINSTQRFRLLEAYASLNVGGYQLSFGKQSLWWGPGEGAAMLFSNNAEPLPMVRFSNVSPVQLPGIGKLLGAIRFESFLGQLDGQQFVGLGPNSDNIVSGPNLGKLVSQPFVNGQKFTFKPTPNLEFSVSRTAIIGGTGLPLTFRSFGHSFFDLGSGSADSTGDRRSGVDLSYKIPGLRNRLLFYADAFTDDDVSPLNYPRRAPMSAGIYIPQLPGVPQMDLRVEGGYTDIPDQDLRGFFYSNRHYLSGYTNDGNLLGSWIGRDGRGIQAWSTYWFSPRTKLQLSYRYQGINDGYLQGGGLLNDVGIRAVENLGNSVDLSQSFQFERWNYPILAGTAQNNVVTTLQITYRPSSWRVKP
jgi:membrane-associated phospholipid phosphatase